MKRRTFVRNSGLAAAFAATSNWSFGLATAQQAPFGMKFAPHLGMFRHLAGDDPLDQLHFMADQGFQAFEDNGMGGRPVELQKAMAAVMQQRGLEMGVFVAHTISWNEPGLASGDPAVLESFLDEIRASVAVAQRVGAKWMTVVPGHQDLRQSMGRQTAHVTEALKQAAAILEPHGLIMVLEPLNFRDHPGLFLTRSDQAYALCKAVDSPSCKILFDIYHQQIQEGNLIPNIEAFWDEIAYFQIGDNPGRKEPTTGEINYQNVFRMIKAKGFEGILGMEHGNSKPDKAGEQAVIAAYRAVDP